jgi:hypothetical protein
MTKATVAVSLDMADGRTAHFEVAPNNKGPACFALSVRKSGSSVFSSMTQALAEFNSVNTVDIPGSMFDMGYRYPDWNGHPRLTDLLWRANAYIGFRDAPTGMFKDPLFREAKKILLVRDPRDALVSEYFSNAYSHSIPTQKRGNSVIEQERKRALSVSIEEYAMKRVDTLDYTVTAYDPIIGDPNLLVIRYEDVIFGKGNWLKQIAAHFGWSASDELIQNILSWADIRPDTENPTAFVRRVAPGDHRDKLSAKAIKRISGQLSAIWQDLGYDLRS